MLATSKGCNILKIGLIKIRLIQYTVLCLIYLTYLFCVQILVEQAQMPLVGSDVIRFKVIEAKTVDENDFEGTLVLERIAEVELLDEFFAAIDADNFEEAKTIMRSADIDESTITRVLQKMRDSED